MPYKTTDAATTMRVQVLLFSVLREKIGAPSLSVELAAPATGADLLDRLADEHPAIGEYRGVLRLGVNEAYEPESVALADGDEVALITPVSGG